MYPDEMGEIKIDQIKRQLRNEEYQAEVRAGNAEFFDQDLPISDGDKARFRRQAETQLASKEKDDLIRINQAIDIKDITTRDELETALDGAPYVSELTKQITLQNWDNGQPLSFEEKSDVLDRLNGLFSDFSSGQISREDYARQHHNITSEIHALAGREGDAELKARARATNPSEWTEGKTLSMSSDKSIDQAIEQEVQVLSDAGEFGITDSITKGDMSKGEIRAILEERKVIKSVRQLVEETVKAHFKTAAGIAELEADPGAIVKKTAEVAASVLTDAVMEEKQQQNDLDIYASATGTMLPPEDSMPSDYELNDRGGFTGTPKAGADLEGNPMDTYIDEDGVVRAK